MCANYRTVWPRPNPQPHHLYQQVHKASFRYRFGDLIMCAISFSTQENTFALKEARGVHTCDYPEKYNSKPPDYHLEQYSVMVSDPQSKHCKGMASIFCMLHPSCCRYPKVLGQISVRLSTIESARGSMMQNSLRCMHSSNTNLNTTHCDFLHASRLECLPLP